MKSSERDRRTFELNDFFGDVIVGVFRLVLVVLLQGVQGSILSTALAAALEVDQVHARFRAETFLYKNDLDQAASLASALYLAEC